MMRSFCWKIADDKMSPVDIKIDAVGITKFALDFLYKLVLTEKSDSSIISLAFIKTNGFH